MVNHALFTIMNLTNAKYISSSLGILVHVVIDEPIFKGHDQVMIISVSVRLSASC